MLEGPNQMQLKQLSASKDVNRTGDSYSIGTEIAKELL
jgi:hypothetical protein